MKNVHFFKVSNPGDVPLKDWFRLCVDKTQFYIILSVGHYGVLLGEIGLF